MNKKITLAALACATAFSTQADLRINGFANLVAGITSTDDMVYDYDDDISFSAESIFAIQVSGDVNDKTTATGQLVARGENDYDPEFEWAYLTYQATDNLAISAGRLRLPLFRYSSSKDVGYSYHWVNAPRAVYDVAFNNLEGLRFDYSNYAGDWEYAFQLAAGTINSEIDIDDGMGGATAVDLKSNNAALFSAEATYEWFKIRGVAGRGTTTFSPAILEPTFQAIGSALPGLAESLRINEDTAEFFGLGIEIDQFTWFVSGEITTIDIADSFSPKDTAYYVTAGIRHGKFTPSITFEDFDGAGDIRFEDQVAVLPEPFRTPIAMANAGVQVAFFTEYDVTTLGLRYDMDTNMALKIDVSKFDDKIDDAGDGNLVRFAVNYVF